MKRRIIAACIASALAISAGAWGRVGHATIAKIAENHLTPEAKAAIARYLDGESIVKYASFADDYKSSIKLDVGFDPVDSKRVQDFPHTFESDMNFRPFRGRNDNGRYVKNCIETIVEYARELKENRSLTDSMIRIRIFMIIHSVGDMHCPEHIRYNPEDMTIGNYDVVYMGKDTRYHKIWDDMCLTKLHPWGFLDTAYLLDTYTDERIAEVTKGDAYDWGEDAARCSYHIHSVKEGEKLHKNFWIKEKDLTESQIRKGGYRLAKVLNECFAGR